MVVYKHEHTHITSPDLEKTVAFYTKVMGAKVTRDQESAGRRMIDIDMGGIPVRISSSTAADKVWQGLRFGLHHLGLRVDSMDRFAAEMKAKGVEFVVAPFQARLGVKLAFIKAPDNVFFEIIEQA